MMLHFNEDTRVKFPATIQFLRLGYEYQSLKGAQIDFETKIFVDRFKTSLERINGYTLRIKKEQIDTTAKAEIRENLDLENQNLDSKDVYESDDYVEGVSKYIEKDFRQFRFVNTDNTIGGMIVCRSNGQARKINKWFKDNSKLTSGLVMSDSENNAVQSALNKLS